MNSCATCPQNDDIPRLEILEIDEREKGGCLKISVYEQDGVYMHGNKNNIRSRSEVVYRPEHGSRTTYYYSWLLFIPNDSSFRDVEAPRSAFHVIAQWHQVNVNRFPCPGNLPPFILSYKHDPHAKSDYRDLAVNYGTHYSADKSRDCDPLHPEKKGFLIIDAIKKGEWAQITTRIHWSADTTGYMQMWINGDPCIVEIVAGKKVLKVKQEDISEATKIFGPNLYVAKETDPFYPGKPVPNYFKVGHYRGYIGGSHTLYIDDFSITTRFPEVATDDIAKNR